MLSHGIVSAALFLCVGVVYDRIHTREIARYGGLAHRMPAYAVVFMLFTMASIGLPGTSGFVGEFLVLVGAFQVNFWLALLGSLGMILGAGYMLYLYRRVIFGSDHAGRPARHPRPVAARDRGVRAAGGADAVDGHLPVQLHPASSTPRAARWCEQHQAALRCAHALAESRRDRAMNWTLALPEIVLACCAHGDPDLRRAAEARQPPSLCTMLAVGALAARRRCWCSPAPRGVGYQRAVRRRRLQPLHEAADPGRRRRWR